VVNAQELRDEVEYRGAENVSVNVLHYDISAEAREPVEFHFGQWLEEYLVALFAPLSFVFVFAAYGYEGMQIRSLAPPSSAESDDRDKLDTRFEDPEKPAWQVKALHAFGNNLMFWTLKSMLFISFFLSDRSKSRAPQYCFYLTAIILCTTLASLANKKGYRKVAADS